MKELVKLFSTITGIFRSVVTIIFLLGIAFVALVDVNLLMAAADIAGFPNIAKGLIKAILIGIFALSFIINVIMNQSIKIKERKWKVFLSPFNAIYVLN